MSSNTPEQSQLGKASSYADQYDPSLLFPIPRQPKRDEIGVTGRPVFLGADLWTAFELSWLNPKGKPQVAIAHITIPAESTHIVESKSFKLYLNSFNNTRFASHDEVKARIRSDISAAIWQGGPVIASAGVKLLQDGGVITAANASQICDGASGVMVVNERGLKALGVQPLARIHHMSVLGHDPVIMLEAPVPATERALKKVGMKIEDIDLYEVNEAFASVPMAWLQALGADPDRLNVHGGAIALGHPLGASGTRLMTTLLNALHLKGKRYGLQTMCEGGGMANVTIVERL